MFLPTGNADQQHRGDHRPIEVAVAVIDGPLFDTPVESKAPGPAWLGRWHILKTPSVRRHTLTARNIR